MLSAKQHKVYVSVVLNHVYEVLEIGTFQLKQQTSIDCFLRLLELDMRHIVKQHLLQAYLLRIKVLKLWIILVQLDYDVIE